MNRRRSGWLSVCGALLLSIGLPIAGQSVDSKHMEGAIETAKTKADHVALAALYEQEAKMVKDKAEEHRRMAKAYGTYGPESCIDVWPAL